MKPKEKDIVGEMLSRERINFDTARINARKGDSTAQHLYGFYFYEGRLVEQNYKEAVRLWKKAAEKGNINAQVDLAYCYKEGKGIKKSILKALYWLKQARDNGDPDAQLEMDEIIEESKG